MIIKRPFSMFQMEQRKTIKVRLFLFQSIDFLGQFVIFIIKIYVFHKLHKTNFEIFEPD